MVRYVISEPVSYQEATPRGILEGSFEAGPVDVEPGSDEHFIIEYVLIPDGYATPAESAPPVKNDPPAPDAAPEPESAPDAPEATEPDAPKE